MIKKLTICLAALALLAVGVGAASAAQVFEGVCQSYDAAGQVLVLNNTQAELNKVSDPQVTFDTSTGKVGLIPEAGDTIRVAYNLVGNKYMAVKVMNVTKQDLRKK
ncbi:MAG: hypothetical protein KQJ78_02425 [Deltaproteobacteria bacterium]|nr:hypothetical protein [Deltaproteobacteria bacterium]